MQQQIPNNERNGRKQRTNIYIYIEVVQKKGKTHEESYTTDYHVFNDSVGAMGAKLKNTETMV